MAEALSLLHLHIEDCKVHLEGTGGWRGSVANPSIRQSLNGICCNEGFGGHVPHDPGDGVCRGGDSPLRLRCERGRRLPPDGGAWRDDSADHSVPHGLHFEEVCAPPQHSIHGKQRFSLFQTWGGDCLGSPHADDRVTVGIHPARIHL